MSTKLLLSFLGILLCWLQVYSQFEVLEFPDLSGNPVLSQQTQNGGYIFGSKNSYTHIITHSDIQGNIIWQIEDEFMPYDYFASLIYLDQMDNGSYQAMYHGYNQADERVLLLLNITQLFGFLWFEQWFAALEL